MHFQSTFHRVADLTTYFASMSLCNQTDEYGPEEEDYTDTQGVTAGRASSSSTQGPQGPDAAAASQAAAPVAASQTAPSASGSTGASGFVFA